MTGPKDIGRELAEAVLAARGRLYRWVRVLRWLDLAGLVFFLVLLYVGVRSVLRVGIGWYVAWFTVFTPMDWLAWRKLDPRRARRRQR